MTVGGGYPQALRADDRQLRVLNDRAVRCVHQGTPQLQGLLLALFVLAADVGDDVIHHFRPGLEGFARHR